MLRPNQSLKLTEPAADDLTRADWLPSQRDSPPSA